MFGIGVTELLILLGILAVVFGASRLPEFGSSMGSALRNFRLGLSAKEDVEAISEETPETQEDRSPRS